MNEQKSDSVLPEVVPTLTEVGENPSQTTKEHKSVLESIARLWHKKNPESILQEKIPVPEISSPITVTDSVPDIQVSGDTLTTPPSEKSHFHISEKIAHIFHKKPQIKNSETLITSETAESIDISEQTTPGKSETPPVEMDERFARLLQHDTTYHSMIRSEDIKNIQLQLSMRYMLLMLAIFVVIAWVVNNRVIMFGFSDFPFLARTRDALFTLLTGLFSLTVWFGASVWFRHRIGTLILQILAGVLFATVLVSIYLPFWL